MKRHCVSTPTAGLALGVALLLTGAFEAGVSVVDPGSGNLLTIEVMVDSADPSVQGLALTEQGPSGSSTQPIPSTWDPIVDRDPAMTLNPYDGQPVVVWSRHDGADFELAMMRRVPGGGWTSFDILTANATSDVEPRVIVDPGEAAHILWWPAALDGPVFLQSFDSRDGRALGSVQRPLDPPPSRKLRTSGSGWDYSGGGDDPGLVGGLTTRASAEPCETNTAAAPDHGVVLACGRPAAYQLSGCYLVVGVFDTSRGVWTQTSADLSSQSLSGTSVREIVQSVADAKCR